MSLVRSEQPHVAARVEAVDRVLAPIVRRLRLDAPSLEGSLRSLADWIALKALSADEADAIVAAIVADRKATVKPSDIETAVKVRVAKRPAEAVLAGEPELMAKWPAVMAWLENKLGREKAQLTFSTFVIESIRTISGKGVVIANLATHLDFKRSEVELSYSAQLRAAVASVFPEVTGVWIETRRAAA